MVQVKGNQIAARVKRQFGDESGVQVTDSDVMMWLNDALREAAIQNSNINLKRKYVPCIADEVSYPLPDATNVIGVHSIQYRASDGERYLPLMYASTAQMDQLFPDWNSGYTPNNAGSGTPAFYSVGASGKFIVYPAPEATYGLGFSILYSSMFTETSDLNVGLEISPRYYQYLVEYCLMKAYEMDENWEAADRKASYIQSTLNVLSVDDANMNQGIFPSIAHRAEDY